VTLTIQEKRVVEALATAWNEFLKLPIDHQDDITEFRHGIHRLQEKVLAMPGRREINGAPNATHTNNGSKVK